VRTRRLLAGLVSCSLASLLYLATAVSVLGGWVPLAVFYLLLGVCVGALAGIAASLPFLLGKFNTGWALLAGSGLALATGVALSALAGTIQPVWHGFAITAGWLMTQVFIVRTHARRDASTSHDTVG